MEQWPKTVTLPRSGKEVTLLREPTVRDSKIADRIVGKKSSPTRRSAALIAQVIRIDGQQITAEDIEDWPLRDMDYLAIELGYGPDEKQSDSYEDEDDRPKNSQTLPSSQR